MRGCGTGANNVAESFFRHTTLRHRQRSYGSRPMAPSQVSLAAGCETDGVQLPPKVSRKTFFTSAPPAHHARRTNRVHVEGARAP